MRALPRRAVSLWLAIGLAGACQDNVVPLGPVNNMSVTNQPGMFRFYAANLNNVIDDTSFVWVTADSQAKVVHNSLVTHGFANVNIFDAKGVLIATSPLVYEADSLTSKGAPGPWKIEFVIQAATGKIDVTLISPP